MNAFEKFFETKTAISIGIILLLIIGAFLLGYQEEHISVRLYYPNSVLSQKNGDPCSSKSLSYVVRKIPLTDTPIQDTIRLLIAGAISDAERAAGFTTEFPNAGFQLMGADLSGGKLTLFFSDANKFSSGGSCRAGLLAEQIRYTVMQFASVKEVAYKPDTLFQP